MALPLLKGSFDDFLTAEPALVAVSSRETVAYPRVAAPHLAAVLGCTLPELIAWVRQGYLRRPVLTGGIPPEGDGGPLRVGWREGYYLPEKLSDGQITNASDEQLRQYFEAFPQSLRIAPVDFMWGLRTESYFRDLFSPWPLELVEAMKRSENNPTPSETTTTNFTLTDILNFISGLPSEDKSALRAAIDNQLAAADPVLREIEEQKVPRWADRKNLKQPWKGNPVDWVRTYYRHWLEAGILKQKHLAQDADLYAYYLMYVKRHPQANLHLVAEARKPITDPTAALTKRREAGAEATRRYRQRRKTP